MQPLASETERSIAEICSAWDLSPIISTKTPITGTIHRTTLLSTNEANYVLRAYRYAQKDRSRILYEHALSSYVKAHGLPAIAPLPQPSGATILEHGGRFYSLYPFARGQQIPREQLISHELIATMGQCLGTLHQLLSLYPHEKVRHQSFLVDRQATFSKIEKLEAMISAKNSPDAFDQQILDMLIQQRAWLMTAPTLDLKRFCSLTQQVIHGDYQETNLFFAEGQVSAIIDWDQAYIAPRAFEIVRTLHYVFNLDAPRCQTFLNAYRDVFPLTQDELSITAQAYGWIQAHNLWPYTSFYIENNHRVRDLIQPGPFIPFEKIWAEMDVS